MGNVNATDDASTYREGYPGKRDDPKAVQNLQFYRNEVKSRPDGDYIDEIHKKWFGDYHLLEAHHGYIQWLFPIREDGLNHHAQQLQLHEAKAIASDPVLQGRIIKSYQLMLDFYGMKLVDEKTGTIERNSNWKSRYQHLNRSFHNYLRITRILKCLGEVGLEDMKIHFVEHVIREMYENDQLKNCHTSCLNYWLPVLRKESDRKKLEKLVGSFHKDKGKGEGPKVKHMGSHQHIKKYLEDSDEDEDNNNNNNNSNKDKNKKGDDEKKDSQNYEKEKEKESETNEDGTEQHVKEGEEEQHVKESGEEKKE